MFNTKYRRIIMPLIMFPVFIGLWKLYITIFRIPSHLLPKPEDLFRRLITNFTQGDMVYHIWTTLEEVFIGVAIGIVIGLVGGYIVAKLKFIERIVMPFVIIVQTAPKISLAPLFILWLGLGLESKIALVVLVVSFPVMINEVMAIRSIGMNFYNLLKVLNASHVQKFIHVELPYSLETIISGIKVALTQAIIGAVIGEMIGAKAGLGYLLILGNETYDISMIINAILMLSLIGLVLYQVAGFMEKKLLYWKVINEEIT